MIMKNWIKSICAVTLACVCGAFLFGCGGGKTVTDLDGNKFGKAQTISASEAPAATSLNTYEVADETTADSNAISITCKSSANMSMSVSGFTVKANAEMEDNYIYNADTNEYYYDVYQYSKYSAPFVGSEETKTYGYSALKDGKLYKLSSVDGKKSVTDLLATTSTDYSEAMTYLAGLTRAATDIGGLVGSSFDGFLANTIDPSEDIQKLLDIVNESGVGKITRQTTENAIKYNISFGSNNDNSDIQTIMNYFLSDSGLEDMDFQDLGIDCTFSNEKVNIYFVLQKQADNSYRVIEQNCELSLTMKASMEGFTETTKLSATSNYRVNAIGDKVIMPW